MTHYSLPPVPIAFAAIEDSAYAPRCVVGSDAPGLATSTAYTAPMIDWKPTKKKRNSVRVAGAFTPTSKENAIMSKLSRRILIASAAALPALSLPVAAATAEVDPIFAAIGRHKAAVEANGKAVHDECCLEEVLPWDRHQSFIAAYGRKIIETDDPRWIEAEEQVEKTGDAMNDAATEILNFEPQTLQGAFAVLRYAVDHMDRYDGEMMGWPDSLLPDGVDPDKPWGSRSAEYFLMKNVAATLERLLSATA
jgi:hypothetical protein